ncbi:MAG: YebC/PmpR family DNA-binding transcriptional regulator [Phycisphaerales bacterium]|nr:YebC/PmpR family DNA-binding transcriptional regulator [Phycisphaerales bacterium]
MAGHNKWSKIKHRKKVVDKRRSKAWTMCSRAIISAARQGGPDPQFNFLLRAAMDEARYYNVPNENVERAIKKGAGGGDTDHYEPVRYEGYGPAGVAIIVEAFTNNRTRTAGDLRLIFTKYGNGGKLGVPGCVAHTFAHKGRILILGSASDEAALMDDALAAGADDLRFEPSRETDPTGPGLWIVLTPPEQMRTICEALTGPSVSTAASVHPSQRTAPANPARWHLPTAEQLKAHAEGKFEGESAAGFDMIPLTTVDLTDADAETLAELVDALEDNEDVKLVYTNAG